MAAKSRALDRWRDYFRSANSEIFDIIEKAIMVAASDCPKELRARRDRIAELLFSCHAMSLRPRCDDSAGLVVTPEDDDVGFKSDFGDGLGSKESKSNSSRDDDQVELNGNQLVSNFSFGQAEALTDEIDEENQIVGEVLRIKQVLQDFPNESDSVLFDSLRRLELMDVNYDILRVTEIGKAVKSLRKCESKEIRQLAKKLIEGWKIMVDEWVKAAEAFTERTPESMNPSIVEDEEGLPSPPLDEGAFFPPQNMELSQFFDGMDDDGNPHNNGGGFHKNREGWRKPPVAKQNAIVPKQREQSSTEGSVLTNETRATQITKREAVPKPLKAANGQFGPGRPVKLTSGEKVGNEVKVQQKPDKPTIQRRPAPQTERLTSGDEDAVQLKIEASKRKLHEGYKQAENAKRQRTIQIMEVHDIPKQKKQGPGLKNTQHGRFGNNGIRQWASGRR
ncbi:hypothetical protein Dimus_002100 [Dionaea muscipula]